MGQLFYQKIWNKVGPKICQLVKEFFNKGKLLKELNHIFIALILKNNNPEITVHFRLISLCNTLHKIIVKVLVNRLRPCLDDIIAPFQSSFVPYLQIHNNILLAHEIMNKFKNTKGKKGWIALKLDMTKAYDKVNWKSQLIALIN